MADKQELTKKETLDPRVTIIWYLGLQYQRLLQAFFFL